MDQRTFSRSSQAPDYGVGQELPKYDVSIILNLHDEARYFKRTMLSLEEAVRYARQFSITFEIVVVLDRADKATSSLVETYDFDVFDGHRIMEVRNGSIGPSRNDGINASKGAYVAIADGDDLVSYDYMYKLYMAVSSSAEASLAFPEFGFAFGAMCYIWKFFDHSYIGNAAFFERHPYVSRMMISKKLLLEQPYLDVSVSSKYAFEDWHFNCECLFRGYKIKVAKGAILFYRQRPGSLMKQFEAKNINIIPRSNFFAPANFVKLTWGEMNGLSELKKPEKPFTVEEFLSMAGTTELVGAANRIDPAISLGILEGRQAGCNLSDISPMTKAYFEVCNTIGDEAFTDVVLLPFMTKGGAEKYILAVLDAIRCLDPGARFLFLGGQKYENHTWLERLPEGSLFIDLHRLGVPGVSQDDIEHITFRIIQNASRIKRIHVKTCEYSNNFVEKFSDKVDEIELYYYYFSNVVREINGEKFVDGYNFDLISECSDNITKVISDNLSNLRFVKENTTESLAIKSEAIYAECDSGARCKSLNGPVHRLLWASRLDAEKKPGLLVSIAKALEETLPDVKITVFGSSAYGLVAPDMFEAQRNIVYGGPFDKFHDLAKTQYDGFIYTTAFDGMPNVVLEALSVGFPVIAPNVGGISEAVSDDTGYLVEDDVDVDTLVGNYLDAIEALYDNWPEAVSRGEKGRKLITKRHSREAFLKRVAEVFGLEQNGKLKPQDKSAAKLELA